MQLNPDPSNVRRIRRLAQGDRLSESAGPMIAALRRLEQRARERK
jgi:hypothetical protein